ncbi:MAG TPA: hypothetical protein ENF87_00305, partial [Thermoproteales archaeon]|nr:hypothetical protein [Thermoproteales archaeon]
GKVYAEFTARNLWTTSRGDKLLEEVRKVRFWRTFSRNLFIDYVVTLKATFQDVLLGDTKEGGIVSFRVAPEIRVKGGRGKIENSFGGINEEESWGKRAHWCDYYGPLEGEIYGIAVFDNPTNPRHPTYWHVRNYGLMTANIFGISYFERKPGKPGNYFLKKGEKITFRYRIYIHKGSIVEANVPLKYIDYVFPPRILV